MWIGAILEPGSDEGHLTEKNGERTEAFPLRKKMENHQMQQIRE